MEIERKWMVKGWPQGLVTAAEYEMEQGYLSVRPTVRIRKEAKTGGETEYILCFKGRGGLARREIETPISPELFGQLRELIGWPLIPKLRRDYPLPGGLKLEVSRVDEGAPTEFWYAEVEFESEAAALNWQPAQAAHTMARLKAPVISRRRLGSLFRGPFQKSRIRPKRAITSAAASRTI